MRARRIAPGGRREPHRLCRCWHADCCDLSQGLREALDLVEAGIIDPTKVVRLALENAVSTAGVLLLTEATMTEVPEPKAEPPSIEVA